MRACFLPISHCCIFWLHLGSTWLGSLESGCRLPRPALLLLLLPGFKLPRPERSSERGPPEVRGYARLYIAGLTDIRSLVSCDAKLRIKSEKADA